MGIKKCDAKYTKPFVGKTNVIVMVAVEGGESTASATQLDYDMVHALEKTIVDCTFIDDEPQTEVNCDRCKHKGVYSYCHYCDGSGESFEPWTDYEKSLDKRPQDREQFGKTEQLK